MYVIDRNSSTPLYQQLVDQIKAQIGRDANLHQMPSLRVVAQTTNLSKNTVATAYEQLVAEGWLENQVRKGYFVTNRFQDHQQIKIDKVSQPTKAPFNLRYAAPLTSTATQNAWKAAVRDAAQTQFTETAETALGRQGLLNLRKLICSQLEARRGIQCTPEQVVVTTGTADAVTLVCQLLENPLSATIENPGYRTAYATLQKNCAHVDLCPVGEFGLDLEALAQQSARLIYVTPAHQFPLGVQMPIVQRRHLLKLVHQRAGLIIEDDYDCEFNYQAQPLPALAALAPEDCCYLGSISKVLSPNLRVGYLVLPPHLVARYHQIYQYHTSPVSYLVQQALVNFIASHAYDRHVQKSLQQNRRKYQLVNQTLQPAIQAGIISANLSEHGLHVVFNLTYPQQLSEFKQLLQTNQLSLDSLDRYCLDQKPSAGFVLGFAHLSLADLKKSLALLQQCLQPLAVP